MQELINQLVQEAGLTPEQAAKAVQTMAAHIKSKVPPAFAANIDAFLGFSSTQQSGTQQANKSADQFKEKAEEFAEAAKDRFEELAGQAKVKLSDAADKAEVMAKEAMDKLKDMLAGGK